MADEQNTLKVSNNAISFGVKVEVLAPCPIHQPEPCTCPRQVVQQNINPHDNALQQMAQLMQGNILFNPAGSIRDTGGTYRAATLNMSATGVAIVAGSGLTAPAFTDYSLEVPVTGSSGSVTVSAATLVGATIFMTGVINNSSGGQITYGEIGVQTTVNGFQYLVAHDAGTTYAVSNGGQLSTTYGVPFG